MQTIKLIADSPRLITRQSVNITDKLSVPTYPLLVWLEKCELRHTLINIKVDTYCLFLHIIITFGQSVPHTILLETQICSPFFNGDFPDDLRPILSV